MPRDRILGRAIALSDLPWMELQEPLVDRPHSEAVGESPSRQGASARRYCLPERPSRDEPTGAAMPHCGLTRNVSVNAGKMRAERPDGGHDREDDTDGYRR